MESILYYSCLFIVSMFATWWVFKKVLRIAIDKNIVDNPDARKIQRVPVPVLGGMAVYFGIIVSLAIAGLMCDISSLFEMGCIMTLMLFIGTMDDIISLTPRTRFIIEILAVLALMFCNDYSINDFHGLWGIYGIPQWVAVLLTIFACVGIINAINLIDGVNGLSSGYCIVTCLIFGFVFYYAGDTEMTTLAVSSVGALLPFFFHNVFGKKSKMFIGDGGTLLMGVIMSSFVINILKSDSLVAACSTDSIGLIPFTLAVLAIPVFDTLRVMSLRIARGTSPFNPDKTHLHHLLMDLHFSHVGTTGTEILSNLFVIFGWWLSYRLGASIDVQLYVVIILGMGITFGFYRFARVQERKKSGIYNLLVRIGDWTHVGHTEWFEWLTSRLDRDC